MLADEYQDYLDKFDTRTINPGEDWYYALKLCGEAGEVAEIIGKNNRLGEWRRPTDVHHLTLELGDVLWYIARLARKYGIPLSEVMRANIEKVNTRHAETRS